MDPFAVDSAATADKPLNWSDVPLEAVKNIPSDAYETGKGIVGGAVNVAKTVAPYARYGVGAPPMMAADAAKAIYNDPSILKKLPAAVWNNLVESYGSEEAIKHTDCQSSGKIRSGSSYCAQWWRGCNLARVGGCERHCKSRRYIEAILRRVASRTTTGTAAGITAGTGFKGSRYRSRQSVVADR